MDIIQNKNFIYDVAKRISELTGLLKSDRRSLLLFLSSLNLDDKSYSQAVKSAASAYINKFNLSILKRQQPMNKQVTNMKFVPIRLDQNINFNNIALTHVTVPLDSRHNLSRNSTEISWHLNGTGHEGRVGDVRIRKELEYVNLIEISPFYIPSVSFKDDYYGHITMLIKELNNVGAHFSEFLSDGVHAVDYHFDFTVERQGNRLLLKPTGPFIPTQHIARLDDITVSFRNPFQEIEFLPDRDSFDVLTGATTDFISSIPHNLIGGELVYVNGFDSINASVNTIINHHSGHFINIIDAYTISLPVNSLGLSSGSVIIVFGDRRIFIQMKFTMISS
jgi:hypothetical protein